MHNCVSDTHFKLNSRKTAIPRNKPFSRNIKYGNDIVAILQNSCKIMDTFVIQCCEIMPWVGKQLICALLFV